MKRRFVIKMVGIGAAGLATGSGLSALITHHAPGPKSRWRFFTDAEASLCTDLCEQIIPRDDTPGATDAGVIFYLDRQLSGKLSQYAEVYREGLDSLDQSCLGHTGVGFEQLDVADKIAFLELVEKGKAPGTHWPKQQQIEFFELLVDHTMQGFYGSPRHGGNRNYISYRILKLAYPQIIGQNRYEEEVG